jgi:uncharacterized protein (DUF924 family)
MGDVMTGAREVIEFWHAAGPQRWFTKDAAFDGELSVCFRDLATKGRDGHLDHWAETADGALGLVILLDQFSRNIFRGTPLMYAADARALGLARRAVARGDHFRFPAPEARWFFMPFEHAEDMDAQERCVGLFQTRGPAENLPYAVRHRDIIARFGRFPHRNAILGRRSRPEEIAYLAGGGFAG